MAAIQQVKPGGTNKGLFRWLVSPAPRMSENLIQVMLPAETGHPERWPLNPLFPQPGKRAGSRAAASQGEPQAIAAAAAAASGETPAPAPAPIGTYPPPRARYPIEIYDADGNPSTAPAAGEECLRPDGACFSYDFLCDAQGTTIGKVSPAIASPFVIQHIQIATDAGPGDGIYVQVLSAPDEILSALPATAGTPVITDGSLAHAGVRAFLPTMDLWPAFYERRNGQHIKVTVTQTTILATRHMTVSISLLLIR